MQLFHASALLATLSTTLLVVPLPAVAKSMIVEPVRSMRGSQDTRALERHLSEAMGEALGCGGHVGEKELLAIELKLEPMWRTLPKNSEGNVERRSLRYLVHRHFSRQSAQHIRGFEPSRPVNASGWGETDILSQQVPAFVERALESRHKLERGFTLNDAALLVATLEQLIFDSEGALLDKVYQEQRKIQTRSLGRQGLEQLLESYMVHWMLGDDEEGIHMLLSNQTLLENAVPHWKELVAFAHGHISELDYRRENEPGSTLADASARKGHNALAPKYTFDDAHAVVGGITKSFASFWESECSSMRETLVGMDTHGTGRVPLSKFYSSALDSEWRFGESEAYLRELGALDETSWLGKQVIIPNYLQAASNCIVSAQHYLVCCVNECEALLDEVETQIGAPSAAPERILAVIGNVSSQTTLDHDFPPQLQGALTDQLTSIAAGHGGQVPLHGRLFAQWMHYAFPRECPFPHRTGNVSPTTPAEFGDTHIATDEEMRKHALAANASDVPSHLGREDLQWMSQWSHEEELLADLQLPTPWRARMGMVAGLAGLAALLGVAGKKRPGAKDGMILPSHSKAHLI